MLASESYAEYHRDSLVEQGDMLDDVREFLGQLFRIHTRGGFCLAALFRFSEEVRERIPEAATRFNVVDGVILSFHKSPSSRDRESCPRGLVKVLQTWLSSKPSLICAKMG